MAHLNPDKSPVVLLWRWGNDDNLTRVDSLTDATMSQISSRNLYENWRIGRASRVVRGGVAGRAARRMFSCQFFEPK